MLHFVKSRFVTATTVAAAILSLAFIAHPAAQAAPVHSKMMKGGMMKGGMMKGGMMKGGMMKGGMMKGGMMKGGMMPQTAASKRADAQVEKIKAGPNYQCCIRPMCDFCAVHMGSCPCGKHAAMGMPVCNQCKGGWDAGQGVVPGKTAADIKVMKPMGDMMGGKMMKGSKR